MEYVSRERERVDGEMDEWMEICGWSEIPESRSGVERECDEKDGE